LRIGIQPEHPVSDAKKFVLDDFAQAEKRALNEILERGADAVRSLLRDGIARAMSLYN
jgi:peptidyl-tRNA hydrolase